MDVTIVVAMAERGGRVSKPRSGYGRLGLGEDCHPPVLATALTGWKRERARREGLPETEPREM